jgi:hypothetical protein
MKLRFEPHLLNLISKCLEKDPKKEIPFNYHKFWNEEDHSKKHPKKTTFDV